MRRKRKMDEKRLYVDLHVVQTVPPSCINRDDTGSPKTAVYGGTTRARVSSQAWKKAMREYFSQLFHEQNIGSRTKKVIEMVADNWSPKNVYVKELYVNGKKYDKSYLKYEDIRDGVKLRFVMSNKPNYKRAVSDEAVAPSLSLPGKTMKYQANLMKTGISNQ